MSLSYKELSAQKSALDAQIAAAQKSEKQGAIQEAIALIADYDIGEYQLFSRSISRAPLATKTPVLAKYKDPETAKTWTGRGKPPLWIAGKDRSQFVI